MCLATDDDAQQPVAERLHRLLTHLGIKRAHFATGNSSTDLLDLLVAHPEVVASMTLVDAGNAEVLRQLASRLLVVGGDSGPIGQQVKALMPDLPAARALTLTGYAHAAWSDVAADRPNELSSALHAFLADMPSAYQPTELSVPARDGEVAGITYRLRGAGTPLVLLPLGLAPNQWTPILASLEGEHTTLVLGGPMVGPAGLVERRATLPGFRRLVASLVEALAMHDGERILDVGCGTGAIDRWLVHHTARRNPIIAVDINQYMLGEAKTLAQKEGLDQAIDFQYGNAEGLPFPDDAFDVTLAVTLLEEGNADRMLAEFVRVTRPGGRVGAIVRADEDLPRWVNVPVSAALKARVEAPAFLTVGQGRSAAGCADTSLYRRFSAAGLTQLQVFPQWYEFGALGIEAAIRAALAPDETAEWSAAVAQARAEGTFSIARPCHCAVGTKP
jgi:SAM-dependent methyltransferase